MLRMLSRFREDEGGAALAMVALFSTALLATAAIAIDLGMVFTARGEAQRAADAAALAGAAVFLEYPVPADPVATAEDYAVEYATRNHVRNEFVLAENVDVEVILAERRVRVWVRRPQVATWFARFVGISAVDVVGYAAAVASETGAVKCLKPWAVQDMWIDGDQDTNGNGFMDPGEEWVFDPDPATGDFYGKADEVGDSRDGVTGYGSAARNNIPEAGGIINDNGRELILKAQDPNDPAVPQPGVFLPWRVPEDGTTEDCATGGGGEVGAAAYRRNICSCNKNTVVLGEEYPIEPGNMVGPTHQGVKALIEQDPDAQWVDPVSEGGQGYVDSPYGMDSPRVVKIALMHPGQIIDSGMQTVKFNNFALYFIEEQVNRNAPIIGRFLYYVSGEDAPGPTTSPLTRRLRLVE